MKIFLFFVLLATVLGWKAHQAGWFSKMNWPNGTPRWPAWADGKLLISLGVIAISYWLLKGWDFPILPDLATAILAGIVTYIALKWPGRALIWMGVIVAIWFFGFRPKSHPDSAGKRPTHTILVPNASKTGEVILEPGESILVWLSCTSSHTRVTGGCVEIKSQNFLGSDCPGIATVNWRHVVSNNYRITNWGATSVGYKWWSD